MPQEYLKIRPRFLGEDEQREEKHIVVFCNFAENLYVEHLDGVLRLLCNPWMEKKESGLKGFLITLFLHGKRWSAYSPKDGERKETMGIHSQSLMLLRRNLVKVLFSSSECSINFTTVFQWRSFPLLLVPK